VGVSRYSAWSRANAARGVSPTTINAAEVLRGTPTATVPSASGYLIPTISFAVARSPDASDPSAR
jgi:hypothetical protein